MADHFGIFHVVYQDKVKTHHHPRHIQIRQLKKDNIRNFKNYLAVADYSSVLATNNTNDAYNNFLNIYQYLFDIACPLKQILVTNKYIKRQPWITSGILTSSVNKAKLLHKKLNKPTELNIELYKCYCRVFDVLKRAPKASYYTAILNEYKNNIKSTWNVLRQAINKQKHLRKLPHTFIINGVEISNSGHIGEEFNNYFVGIGQSLSNSIPLPNIKINITTISMDTTQ